MKPKIIFGDGAEATFLGICPICGYENGFYFQYPGKPGPNEDEFTEKPPCKNEECPNEFCEWIDEKRAI